MLAPVTTIWDGDIRGVRMVQNHRHLRLVYRHAMRHADILRIDHVMGLHRQFWIPRGASVAEGVYIQWVWLFWNRENRPFSQ